MAEEVEWFVGVDWGSQSHQVCLFDASGECLEVSHNPAMPISRRLASAIA
jgi:ribulose kinase